MAVSLRSGLGRDKLRRYCQRWNRGQGRSYNGIDQIYEMSGLETSVKLLWQKHRASEDARCWSAKKCRLLRYGAALATTNALSMSWAAILL